MKNIHSYKCFLGKNKYQIMEDLGSQNNDFSSDVWKYFFHKGWWFMRKQVVIYIYFENNKAVFIKKFYKKRKQKPFIYNSSYNFFPHCIKEHFFNDFNL